MIKIDDIEQLKEFILKLKNETAILEEQFGLPSKPVADFFSGGDIETESFLHGRCQVHAENAKEALEKLCNEMGFTE